MRKKNSEKTATKGNNFANTLLIIKVCSEQDDWAYRFGYVVSRRMRTGNWPWLYTMQSNQYERLVCIYDEKNIRTYVYMYMCCDSKLLYKYFSSFWTSHFWGCQLTTPERSLTTITHVKHRYRYCSNPWSNWPTSWNIGFLLNRYTCNTNGLVNQTGDSEQPSVCVSHSCQFYLFM